MNKQNATDFYLHNQITYSIKDGINKGLAIDLLSLFTTKYGTSKSLARQEIKKIYSHIREVDKLINSLIDNQLLVEKLEYPQKNHWQPAKSTGRLRLSHDTLAQVIKNTFEQSNEKGQIARKILKSRVEIEKSFLSKSELGVIHSGIEGMRRLSLKEQLLIERSKEKLQKDARKSKNKNLVLGFSFFTLILILSFYISIKKRSARIAKSKELVQVAKESYSNGEYDKSLLLAEIARQQHSTKETKKAFYEAAIAYAFEYDSLDSIAVSFKGTRPKISNDDKYIITLQSLYPEKVSIFKTNGQRITDLNIYDYNFLNDSIAFGTTIFQDTFYIFNLNSEESTLLLGQNWEFSRDYKYAFANPSTPSKFDETIVYSFSEENLDTLKGDFWEFTDNSLFLYKQNVQEGKLFIYNLEQREIDTLSGYGGYFSPDGRFFIYLTIDRSLDTCFIFNTQNKSLDTLNIYSWRFSNNSKYLFTSQASNDKKIDLGYQSYLLKLEDSTFDTIPGTGIQFSFDSKLVLTDNIDSSYLFNLLTKKIKTFFGTQGNISNRSKYLYTNDVKGDKILMYSIQGELLNKFKFDGPDYFFSNDDKLFIGFNRSNEKSQLYYIKSQQIEIIDGIPVGFWDNMNRFLLFYYGSDYYLYDCKEKIKFQLLHSGSLDNTLAYLKSEKIMIFDEKRKQTLIWHVNPLLLKPRYLISKFSFNPELIDSVEKSYNVRFD